MVNLRDKYNVNVNFKLVYPLAIREPEFFKGKNLFTYFYIRSIDHKKHAKLNGMKFVAPKPDPINQNMLTGKISKHQPYIFKLCHFCQAIEKSKQLDFALEVSNLIFGGFQDWHMDESISAVTAKLGLNFNDIEQSRQQNDDKLKDEILLNQKQQLEAGHHGVPLTVYKDKFFFGQDRFHHLISALEQDGLIYK